jgi:hypothetical protein
MTKSFLAPSTVLLGCLGLVGCDGGSTSAVTEAFTISNALSSNSRTTSSNARLEILDRFVPELVQGTMALVVVFESLGIALATAAAPVVPASGVAVAAAWSVQPSMFTGLNDLDLASNAVGHLIRPWKRTRN